MKTAYATIKGFEVMRALRKGQAAIFNITRDIHGEARLVERAFDLGACALTEAMQFVRGLSIISCQVGHDESKGAQ